MVMKMRALRVGRKMKKMIVIRDSGNAEGLGNVEGRGARV
jgi:hypothetical protein